mgnify:CR=1 FL=1
MNRMTQIFAATLTVGALLAATAADARTGRVKVRGTNGVASAAAGPNGGAVVRGRGWKQNSDGSVTAASGGAFRTPSGAIGGRASTTTVNPDGSATHSGGFAAQGPNGAVKSQGSVARSADGTWSGGRSTSATNANTGNSYEGSTTIDPATGKPVHTGTCYDANGNAYSCR